MDEVLKKLVELVALLQDKVTKNTALQDQLNAGVTENKQLAETLSAKEKDLNKREKEIKQVEDIIAFGNEAQGQAKKNEADLAELAVQRNALSTHETEVTNDLHDRSLAVKAREDTVTDKELKLLEAQAKLEADRQDMKAQVLAEIKASL
jgi:predicted nuclease with TOPRIM domain